MKKICLKIALGLLCACGYMSAGEVTTYSAITKGFDIKIYGSTVYSGTDGGLISLSNGKAVIYDTDDGIYKPEINLVEKDFRNIFWLGHPDCSISLYDIESKSSVYLDDIEQAGVYTLNAVYSSDKYIYVGTSGLLARYRYNRDFKKYEISDINSMTGNVRDITSAGGNIYICTDSGVFWISEDSPNINYMNNWVAVPGLESAVSNSFAKDGENVFVLANNGLYGIESGEALKETVFDGIDLKKGYFGEGKLFVCYEQVEATVVSSVGSDISGVPEIIFGTEDENFRSFRQYGGVLYFTSTGGLSYFVISEDEEYALSFNVPKEKGIKKIIFDKASSKLLYLTNYRFSYADISDMTFHADMFPSRGNGTNFHLKGDELYIGTWGAGVNLFEFQDPKFVFKKNYSFGGAREVMEQYNIRYPVHPGIAEDINGNIWITNWDDSDQDSTIVRIASDGQIKPFVTTDYFYGYDIFVDRYNDQTWVWLGSSQQSFGSQDGIGVGIYDGQNLIIRKIPISEGVIDIVRDKNNTVWIATNNGVKYIDLSMSSANPLFFSTANVNAIQSGPIGNTIYDVEVNGINEKWFATENGISVLSADNDKWRHYVPKFLKDIPDVPGDVIRIDLPDKAVFDIGFDEENGIAVIGSFSGITLFEYGKIFKTGDVKKGDIQTKPSPFINDGSSIMGFYFPEDGNSYDTAKIIDMKGFLIRGGDGGDEFDIRNGWDGRDNKGKIVSSGIYKIVAYNKNDRTVNISGKIAVVRR